MKEVRSILDKIKDIFLSIDWVLFILIFIIMLIGILTMSSFEEGDSLFSRQLILISISLFSFILFSFFDYRNLKNTYLVVSLYIFFVILLIFIFIIGHVSKGGNRWFNLGSFFIGPSEPMKLILIILLAKFFSKRHVAIANIRNILISLIYLAIPAILVLLQPDLSTAIVLGLIWFGMVLVSGLSKKHLIFFIISALTASLLLWNFYFMDYQKDRIITFINPTHDIRGTGWNAYQSVITVGSGGLLGKGVGYGTQSRLGFLPEHETDFIFASFLEEWGFIGAMFIFIVYSILIFYIVRRSVNANSNFESLFTLGVAIWFVSQLTMNIGMNIGLLPVTGIPLPLMSHGGSHLITECIALGICVGMSRYSKAAHPSRFKNEFLGLE
jgi:rod shape determining protein RodA